LPESKIFHKSTGETIPNGSWEHPKFTHAYPDKDDTFTGYTSTTSGEWDVPADGDYFIDVIVAFSGLSTGKTCAARILKNGSALKTGPDQKYEGVGSRVARVTEGSVTLSKNDTIEVEVKHDDSTSTVQTIRNGTTWYIKQLPTDVE
jgi:hypothetical protein